MFRKLAHTYSNLNYRQGKKQISYGDVISYFDAELTAGGVFYVLPLRYRPDFHLAVMDITDAVPPHTDSEINCTINFYVETEPCVTKFYRSEGNSVTLKIPDQTNGRIYDKDNLVCTGEFMAKSGDAYLLDVTKIHAVQPLFGLNKRTAITLCTDKYDYDQVSEMLYETGN
jgi:hypothetical protein